MNDMMGAEEAMTMVVVPSYGTKTCPRCGVDVFEDMDVCYDCLYEFSRGPVGEEWDEELVPTEAYEGDVAGQDLQTRLRVRVKASDVEVVMPLLDSGLLVGRGSGCDVVLHGRSVSRRHVLIVPREGRAVVCDQGATNHATIGGESVTDESPLSPGEVLNVCGTTFVLEDAPRREAV